MVALTLCILDNFSCDNFFTKNSLSECPMVWIQIRPDVCPNCLQMSYQMSLSSQLAGRFLLFILAMFVKCNILHANNKGAD